jgi:hypothetical protein
MALGLRALDVAVRIEVLLAKAAEALVGGLESI